MSEIRSKNGTAVHDITLTNGVKVSLVEMEGAIYLEMHDPDPITFVKISTSKTGTYSVGLTEDQLDRLLYSRAISAS